MLVCRLMFFLYTLARDAECPPEHCHSPIMMVMTADAAANLSYRTVCLLRKPYYEWLLLTTELSYWISPDAS